MANTNISDRPVARSSNGSRNIFLEEKVRMLVHIDAYETGRGGRPACFREEFQDMIVENYEHFRPPSVYSAVNFVQKKT